MRELLLRIITKRNDGCFVRITWLETSTNRVLMQLLSSRDVNEIVNEEEIDAKGVVQWINARHDW